MLWLVFVLIKLFWAAPAVPGPHAAAKSGVQTASEPKASNRFGFLHDHSPFDRPVAALGMNTENLPLTTLNIALLGIRQVDGGNGSAILRTDGIADYSFIVGEEIIPGVRLSAVHTDHVVLSRGGRQERLFLDGTDTKNLNR